MFLRETPTTNNGRKTIRLMVTEDLNRTTLKWNIKERSQPEKHESHLQELRGAGMESERLLLGEERRGEKTAVVSFLGQRNQNGVRLTHSPTVFMPV